MPVLLALLLLTLASGCRMMDTKPADNSDPEPGVALTLAAERVQSIKNLKYSLRFAVPSNSADPIEGHASLRFSMNAPPRPLVLDFTPGTDHLKSIRAGGKISNFRVVQDHIIIPEEEIVAGDNTIEIDFRTGDLALNRNPEFMYTLFVPARARSAFPCFDQPDLKGRFTLELDVPAEWNAVANGEEVLDETTGGRRKIRYAETQPIPTYLFAFAAGKFQIETAEIAGRRYRVLHRETDAAKVARNRNAVFQLHASSLDWLEKYTTVPYSFGKFDFVLIPSFQFGGMEHPGAIFYNANGLLLDESATENQILNRASVIAHETSHMWFGDLVTMQWFNDVWMKEVFANFMAAKIVNPAFPKLNHELRFLTEHYPFAYAVDRTEGTHPIRQELANLNEAGSLYGAIIYEKAPIVMRQLERILGPQNLQEGLQIYLKQFAFGNATWQDLIQILDAGTDLDLRAWSHAWVEEAGRPSVRTAVDKENVTFIQSDARRTQEILVTVGTNGRLTSISATLQGERTAVKLPTDSLKPDFILPTGGGLAYGDFSLDDDSRAFLLSHLPKLNDALTRGAAWITLWEEVQERRVEPVSFLDLALRALRSEETEQNVQLVLGYVDDVFWIFLTDSQRQDIARGLEQVLRDGLARAPTSSMKATYFNAFRATVTTREGVQFLERVWRRQEKIQGLTLSEPDEAAMALDLAVRSVPASASILEEQRSRFKNPDRKARFEFVTPALSALPEVRDAWFQSLREARNRSHEPWVLEGLRYLHHPLRAASSEKYIRPALDLLTEIQRTGDIFFPTRWMNATLGGHNTASAAKIVSDFLMEQTSYPMRLRRIILQESDTLRRAVR
jgi:aminopeptidase N